MEMETDSYTLSLHTDSAGRRFVELPHCPQDKCADCGACGGRESARFRVILENGADLRSCPDGMAVRVTVKRANPAMLAVMLFLVPLGLVFAGGFFGNSIGGHWGMIIGAIIGAGIAVGTLCLGQRYWRALRVWATPPQAAGRDRE